MNQAQRIKARRKAQRAAAQQVRDHEPRQFASDWHDGTRQHSKASARRTRITNPTGQTLADHQATMNFRMMQEYTRIMDRHDGWRNSEANTDRFRRGKA